jgi:hypothetical protein
LFQTLSLTSLFYRLIYAFYVLSQAGVAPGQTFSINHENRIFEVIAPEGCNPGETINIIVAKVKYDDLQSILEVGTAALTSAGQAINSKYSIVARATAAFEAATQKAAELDEKFKLSASSMALAAKDVAQSAIAKIQNLNEKYEVSAKVKDAVDRLVVYAVEIDAKYALRTTAARLVVDGVNAVVNSKYVTPMTLPASGAARTTAPASASPVEVPIIASGAKSD